jgi:protein translocase SecG subunit
MSSSILVVIMLISGIVFSGCILLMAPKGGLGVAIGGAGAANDYGSKKSFESTLKRTALVSVIVFLVTVLLLPYIA